MGLRKNEIMKRKRINEKKKTDADAERQKLEILKYLWRRNSYSRIFNLNNEREVENKKLLFREKIY